MAQAAELNVGNDDLPALYRAADDSSLTAQREYLRYVKCNLVLIVCAAAATSYAASSAEARTALAIAAAVFFAGGAVLTGLVYQQKPDAQWYVTRAVAESVKTIAWRYMTCAEPYLRSLTSADADRLFTGEVMEILRQRGGGMGAALGGLGAAGEQITARMREVRATDLNARKDVYLRGRIGDQREWYAGKAIYNRRSAKFWLICAGTTQLLGIGAAVCLVAWPTFEVNFAVILTAIAASVLTWLQVKRSQELSQSYGIAAHELGLIQINAQHITTEAEFASFVADAENAVSREHTMWIARRDTFQ